MMDLMKSIEQTKYFLALFFMPRRLFLEEGRKSIRYAQVFATRIIKKCLEVTQFVFLNRFPL